MAHHRSTPQSILDAPTPSVVILSPSHGLSRAERRGHVAVSMERRFSAVGKRNTPFVGKVRDALAALTPRTRDARGYYAMPSAVDLEERV